MKRVDWEPGGDPDKVNAQNRGKSKFKRISWDEALKIICDEIVRVQEEYGPLSILCQTDGHGEAKGVHGPHGCPTWILRHLGSFTYQARQPDSWEGWYWGAKHVWGQDPIGKGNVANVMQDIARNTDILLHWGCDEETTPWAWGGQTASRLSFWLSELGIKRVYVCPDLNYAAAVHADKWIPVLPNTDAALHCAIMYVWLTEDTWDKEYVDTHVVGFESLRDYILGEEDGIPKTPAWASEICGVPSRTIKALARAWAKYPTSTCHGNGGGYIRSAYSHEPARLEVCALGMQGLGKAGRQTLTWLEWDGFGGHESMPLPRKEFTPNIGGGAHQHPTDLKISPCFIPKTLIPEAILGDYTDEHPLTWQAYPIAGHPVTEQFITYQWPHKGAERLKMIWSDSPSWTTCWNGGNKLIDAYRSPEIETFIMQHPWFENDCLFADLLLPVSTKFEEEDICVDHDNGNFNTLFYEGRCIDKVGESYSDWEIACMVAEKLDTYGGKYEGIFEKTTGGNSIEDFIRLSFESSGVQTRMSYEEFREKEYYVVPTAEGWEHDPAGYEMFYYDPEGHPLKTPTGKLEYYSQRLADAFPEDTERPPSPRYIAEGPLHQESLSCERAKDYPYLMVTNHPRWRCHSQHDDITWLREIETCKVTGADGYQYEPVWLNPIDAEKIGAVDGDVIKIFNERGAVLGGLIVTERVMPGCVYQDHGARLDPIVVGELDRGGANNLICPTNITSKHACGEVTNGFLVNIEKVDLEQLRRDYPEAMNRTYDGHQGVDIENWFVEE